MESPEHDNEVVKLRKQLQCLEQENDDLQSYVRRLEATEEDLNHKIERAEEEVVFAQQELEYFREEHAMCPLEEIDDLRQNLQKYKNVVSRLLSVVDLPDVTQESAETFSDVEANELESELDSRNGDTDDIVQENAGDTDELNCAAHGENEQKWTDVVEKLRSEIRTKSEQLQAVEHDYEEFMVTSYNVEKALASESSSLKHSIAALQTENARLQHLLVTGRKS
uniref:Uncharacterized protein n=1 Tax=Peronospora matthiolae TaxID=2874970 RepID=A0AAV1TRJ8_9STRA